MKRTLGLMLFAATARLAASAGVIYVTPSGAGEKTGADWANAMTFSSALTEAAAREAGDRVIYLSQGVYSTGARGSYFTVTAAGTEIYGGFAGASTDETVAGRDVWAHQTIFQGDLGNDDYWKHVTPVFGTFAREEENLTTEKVVVDGRINLPAYTGEHDTYVAVYAGDKNNCNEFAIRFNSGSSGRIDGCIFTGYISNHAIYMYGSGALTVANCHFIGEEHGVDHQTGSYYTTITNCVFRHLTGHAIRALDKLRVIDCRFEGCASSGLDRGGSVAYLNNGYPTFTRCVIARHFDLNPATSDKLPGGLIYCWDGMPTLTDCVMTNNVLQTKIGAPFLSMRYCYEMNSCVFADNRLDTLVATNKAYVMVGPYESTQNQRDRSFNRCVFASNTVCAVTTAIDDGVAAAIGIAGNGSTPGYASFANCTFDGNRAITDGLNGTGVVRSRGILSACTTTLSVPPEIGVFNCTFTGPALAGAYDVALFGSSHTLALKVYNSLFQSEDAVTQPFYSDMSGLLTVQSSTVKNLQSQFRPDNVTISDDLELDAFPLEQVRVFGTPYGHYRPTAMMPKIRTTVGVATNNPAFPRTYQIRSGTTWSMPIASQAYSKLNATKSPIGDAFDVIRPLDANTRGAVQTLTAAAEAEDSHTLILRADPVKYGAFTGAGSAQCVAAGQTSASATAVPLVEGVTFDGWYDTNGVAVAGLSGATISGITLTEDTVYVARFATPKVNVTFDLGSAGTFVETGTSTYVTNMSAGAAFPAVPAYVESASWHVGGWLPALPSEVPSVATTYAADSRAADLRICVVPAGEGTQDPTGEGWSHATTDFAAAYEKAEKYRLELWMKGGVYPFSTAVDLRDVAVRGGFAGGETRADEADPEAHPTVITGDLGKDAVWLTNGLWAAAADRVAVYDYENLRPNPPNPDGTSLYWNSSGGDTYHAFTHLSGEKLGDLCFSGIDFTGFVRNAFDFAANMAASLTFEKCRFIACNTQGTADAFSVIDVPGIPVAARDCAFYGSYYVFYLPNENKVYTNVFANCLFDGNTQMILRNNSRLYVTNCVFRRNYSARGEGAGIWHSVSATGRSTFVDTRFEDNVNASGNAPGVLQLLGRSVSDVIRCRFTGNRLAVGAGDTKHTAALGCHESTGYVTDCYFGTNVVATGATSQTWGSAASNEGGYLCFLNCTFDENRCSVGAGAAGGTVVATSNYGLSFWACTFVGSVFGGDGTKAEINLPTGNNSTFVTVVNSVFANDTADYAPFSIASATPLGIASCAAKNYDQTVLPSSSDCYYYAVTNEASGTFRPVLVGQNGAWARRPGGGASFARSARKLVRGTNDILYFYQGVEYPAYPWRRGDKVGSSSLLTALGAAAIGITTDSPNVVDAFGDSRVRRFSLGAVNAVRARLLVTVY